MLGVENYFRESREFGMARASAIAPAMGVNALSGIQLPNMDGMIPRCDTLNHPYPHAGWGNIGMIPQEPEAVTADINSAPYNTIPGYLPAAATTEDCTTKTDQYNPPPVSPPPQRERFSYTRYQLELLNGIYGRIRYPNSMQKQLIAKRVGITREQAKIWFQNRRRKDIVNARNPEKAKVEETQSQVMVSASILDGIVSELLAYEDDPKGKKLIAERESSYTNKRYTPYTTKGAKGKKRGGRKADANAPNVVIAPNGILESKSQQNLTKVGTDMLPSIAPYMPTSTQILDMVAPPNTIVPFSNMPDYAQVKRCSSAESLATTDTGSKADSTDIYQQHESSASASPKSLSSAESVCSAPPNKIAPPSEPIKFPPTNAMPWAEPLSVVIPHNMMRNHLPEDNPVPQKESLPPYLPAPAYPSLHGANDMQKSSAEFQGKVEVDNLGHYVNGEQNKSNYSQFDLVQMHNLQNAQFYNNKISAEGHQQRLVNPGYGVTDPRTVNFDRMFPIAFVAEPPRLLSSIPSYQDPYGTAIKSTGGAPVYRDPYQPIMISSFSNPYYGYDAPNVMQAIDKKTFAQL